MDHRVCRDTGPEYIVNFRAEHKTAYGEYVCRKTTNQMVLKEC